MLPESNLRRGNRQEKSLQCRKIFVVAILLLVALATAGVIESGVQGENLGGFKTDAAKKIGKKVILKLLGGFKTNIAKHVIRKLLASQKPEAAKPVRGFKKDIAKQIIRKLLASPKPVRGFKKDVAKQIIRKLLASQKPDSSKKSLGIWGLIARKIAGKVIKRAIRN